MHELAYKMGLVFKVGEIAIYIVAILGILSIAYFIYKKWRKK